MLNWYSIVYPISLYAKNNVLHEKYFFEQYKVWRIHFTVALNFIQNLSLKQKKTICLDDTINAWHTVWCLDFTGKQTWRLLHSWYFWITAKLDIHKQNVQEQIEVSCLNWNGESSSLNQITLKFIVLRTNEDLNLKTSHRY